MTSYVMNIDFCITHMPKICIFQELRL